MSGPLCNLSVLCVSVVNSCVKNGHHRGTEDTEVAQRRQDWVRVRRTAIALNFGMVLLLVAQPAFPQRRASVRSQPLSSTLVISSEPNAIIWIDEIRRGVTDAAGRLELKKVLPGRHAVRVRARGFREVTTSLLPGKRSLTVRLVRATDQAELLFQQAEEAREKA